MTGRPRIPRDGQADAAERVCELSRLFESIRHRLDQMVQTIGETDESSPKAVIQKLNELQTAHLKVLAAEEAFYDQHGTEAAEIDVDFSAIRIEIGRQLDRIRDAIGSEEIPGSAE